jgi:hypothetical protein
VVSILAPASISYLEQFHATFNKHCKRFFPSDLLFENCCEEFGSHIQQSLINSSSSESKGEFSVEEEEYLVIYESSYDPFIQKMMLGIILMMKLTITRLWIHLALF